MPLVSRLPPPQSSPPQTPPMLSVVAAPMLTPLLPPQTSLHPPGQGAAAMSSAQHSLHPTARQRIRHRLLLIVAPMTAAAPILVATSAPPMAPRQKHFSQRMKLRQPLSTCPLPIRLAEGCPMVPR